MDRRLPAVIHLPSGRKVRLRAVLDGASPAPTLRGALSALGGGRLSILVGSAVVRPEELALEDFHVVRAVATQAGLLTEEPPPARCVNCEAALVVHPSAELEIAPYVDGELDDDELDEPFPWDEDHPIPTVKVAGKEAETVRLRPITTGEAVPLFAALERRELRLTSQVVQAMGIVQLGDETRPQRIARALTGASDEAFGAIVSLFDAAHYAPRLTAEVLCDACGARTLVPAPALREFPPGEPIAGAEVEGFPTLADFEDLVREHGDRLYRRAGVTRVDLVVDEGVAACDDGGIPLLGSYVPGALAAPGYPEQAPEVRVYYRTFRSMFRDDGPYDVSAEVAETIEHELEHHLSHLRGWDPEDEEERAVIVRDRRRVVGETESIRRASRAARGELADFVYRTWPIWAIALLGTLLYAAYGR